MLVFLCLSGFIVSSSTFMTAFYDRWDCVVRCLLERRGSSSAGPVPALNRGRTEIPLDFPAPPPRLLRPSDSSGSCHERCVREGIRRQHDSVRHFNLALNSRSGCTPPPPLFSLYSIDKALLTVTAFVYLFPNYPLMCILLEFLDLHFFLASNL